MTQHDPATERPAAETPDQNEQDGQHEQGAPAAQTVEQAATTQPTPEQQVGEQPLGAPDADGQAAGDEAAGGDAGEEPVVLSGTPTQRLAQLGITLPVVPVPVADYVPAVRTGQLVHTSGQLPFFSGELTTTGVVGDEAVDVTAEEAALLARQCALNALAAVATLVDLDDVVRVVKVTGFVASAPGFAKQPVVLNGASQLLGQVFGDAGRHARSAVGVAALPLGAPVEVEIVVEVG